MFSHGEVVLIILSCHLCTLTFVPGPPCRAGLNELYAATQKSLETKQKLLHPWMMRVWSCSSED